MNPIRSLLNTWRWSGESYKLEVYVDTHSETLTRIDSIDIVEINPNGFTAGTDFEIPYHRVKEIWKIEVLPHERDTIKKRVKIYGKS